MHPNVQSVHSSRVMLKLYLFIKNISLNKKRLRIKENKSIYKLSKVILFSLELKD